MLVDTGEGMAVENGLISLSTQPVSVAPRRAVGLCSIILAVEGFDVISVGLAATGFAREANIGGGALGALLAVKVAERRAARHFSGAPPTGSATSPSRPDAWRWWRWGIPAVQAQSFSGRSGFRDGQRGRTRPSRGVAWRRRHDRCGDGRSGVSFSSVVPFLALDFPDGWIADDADLGASNAPFMNLRPNR